MSTLASEIRKIRLGCTHLGTYLLLERLEKNLPSIYVVSDEDAKLLEGYHSCKPSMQKAIAEIIEVTKNA